jgi:hypothetical protein
MRLRHYFASPKWTTQVSYFECLHLFPPMHNVNQGQTPSSSASSWIKNSTCRTRLSMHSCSTSFACPTHTKLERGPTQMHCRCYGTRVYWYSSSGMLLFNPLPLPNELINPQHRYASDLTPDQKDALLDVVRASPHAQIGPEIRRELVNSVVRGAPRTTDGDVEMT